MFGVEHEEYLEAVDLTSYELLLTFLLKVSVKVQKILRLVQFIYIDPNFCPFSKKLVGYEDILVEMPL